MEKIIGRVTMEKILQLNFFEVVQITNSSISNINENTYCVGGCRYFGSSILKNKILKTV